MQDLADDHGFGCLLLLLELLVLTGDGLDLLHVDGFVLRTLAPFPFMLHFFLINFGLNYI